MTMRKKNKPQEITRDLHTFPSSWESVIFDDPGRRNMSIDVRRMIVRFLCRITPRGYYLADIMAAPNEKLRGFSDYTFVYQKYNN